ncbi:MAG: 1,4-alpha-glucan branching protein GlgB [Saprospiraceae bacterium]
MESTTNKTMVSLFTDYDIELFKSGKHFRLYEKMGSHPMEVDGQKGIYFAVWAPTAQSVSVMGDFNGWDNEQYPLSARWDGSGIWEGFVADVGQWEVYKYSVVAYNGMTLEKGDPFARHWETRPATGSKVYSSKYKWKDSKWMKQRKKLAGKPQPMSVYEVHLASWKRRVEESNRSLTYREMADEMVAYVAETGFTHVEMMPVMEHPYDPSWGYQITGFFAPTSRFGTPDDFKYLVDAFHQAGIGVILDWVPSHFPADIHGLALFDGTYLYDHADPRKGFHPDWKSCIFNYGRNEVRSFLISNALFWLDQYHADGLRVDAVASMLYLDYSRNDGEWIPNEYGGNENLEAISFLKEFNDTVYKEYPDAITIAEESTAFTGVSRPTSTGGLGFGQKWMMGWMHDTIKYFEKNPIYRKFHQNDITFSTVYAFTENFMLPLSHDEVVYGKGSMLQKMPGDEWQKFANLRALYGYMFMHPGTKLLFMGGEFGQSSEWNFKGQLDWHLLQYDFHNNMRTWIQKLNEYYKSTSAIYEKAFDYEGFEWIDHQDHNNNIISFLRKGKNTKKPVLVVCNFSPKVQENYKIGVPIGGKWKQVLNSDATEFSGSGVTNNNTLTAKKQKEPWHGKKQALELKLAPLAVMVFEKV